MLVHANKLVHGRSLGSLRPLTITTDGAKAVEPEGIKPLRVLVDGRVEIEADGGDFDVDARRDNLPRREGDRLEDFAGKGDFFF